jgi:DNA modification methylase
MTYPEFLASKRIIAQKSGFDVPTDQLNPQLKDWQQRIVTWALRRGKAAIFADTGLGKTFMLLEWARWVSQHTGGNVLVLTPLAVAQQTKREGLKFGIDVTVCRSQDDVQPGINVTNYEMLDHFDTASFAGVVLDESSLIKEFTGATTKRLIEEFANTPYKLACTATPSPNDHMELGTHAELLGAMSRVEMLAMYFTHDGGDTSKWRLKGHAERKFWQWVASWAVYIQKPSDIGGSDEGYDLPTLHLIEHQVAVDQSVNTDGMLFRVPDMSATGLHKEMRLTSDVRAARVAELVHGCPDEPWLIWCNTGYEADAIRKALPEVVEIKGADTPESKERRISEFIDGEILHLLTKSSICGFGLNMQHCCHMAFAGLSYSYEQLYQAIRRCWRFGQEREVYAHIVIAETEGEVLNTIKRKQRDHEDMKVGMRQAMKDIQLGDESFKRSVYTGEIAEGAGWSVAHADCVEYAKSLPDDSVHFTVFSPPFASLYVYSDAEEDMGNSRSYEEFFQHFGYLEDELFRVTMPGRLCAMHCMNLPTTIQHHGVIGIQDFRGHLIQSMRERGFIYHSEVCIWKDPVTAMQRTKAIGLLYKQLRKDSTISRQGIPDYLVIFRKTGPNPEPVTKTHESFPVDLWQQYASPVWMDINMSDTLQRESAREASDERHIAPLQLEVIRRAIRLWSNPGDTVFDPFTGIGSTGVVALEMGRQFIGSELKGSYFSLAARNLAAAEGTQAPLFATAEQVEVA